MTTAIDFARQHQQRFLDELKTLLRIPSVSTDPAHRDHVRQAATHIAGELNRIGLENVRLIETAGTSPTGHPLVYADWLHAPGAPTVLFYGHYDVQPPEPLDEWLSPPFEPTERDGNLYARGAVDDKGQMFMHLKAVEALFVAHGKLPLNVRFLIEGEEEVGGEGIAAYVATKPTNLAADFAVVSDTSMFAPGLPTLCVGLRGMIYTEIEVRSARTDLHSGYGGAAPNSFNALAHILAKIKDASGRVLIPGILDSVQTPAEDELRSWQSLPFSEDEFRETVLGSQAIVGDDRFTVFERLWAQPTFDVHGMPGGFTGVGAKTVIPAKATAKASMRLVPNMSSADTFARFRDYIHQVCPPGVSVEVRLIHSAEPSLIPVDNPWIRAAATAMTQVWGRETVFVRTGGSIPIVGDLQRHLGLPCVMMGFGLADDNLHAPNEKFCLRNFHLGIESILLFLESAAALRPAS